MVVHLERKGKGGRRRRWQSFRGAAKPPARESISPGIHAAQWILGLASKSAVAALDNNMTNSGKPEFVRTPGNDDGVGRLGCYPQFHAGPIGVQLQHGPKLPPL